MKKIIFILILLIIFSCSKEEAKYPWDQSPYVEFESLKFFDSQPSDTLQLSFIVWDKEGDVGYGNEDQHHPFELIIDNNQDPVTISGKHDLPFYTVPVIPRYTNDELEFIFLAEPLLFSEIDNRPEYSCEDYYLSQEFLSADLFYRVINQNFYNLKVEFLDNSGAEYDFGTVFGEESCNFSFDARLFDLSSVGFSNPAIIAPFQVAKQDKYSWRVTYNIVSFAIPIAVNDKSFEVHFFIKDRQLNDSNVATSGLAKLDE